MPTIGSYSLLFYGSPSGYQTNRAQIALKGTSGKIVAFIRFNDPGQFFEDDFEIDGVIRMRPGGPRLGGPAGAAI